MVSITDRLPRPLPRIRRGRQSPILAAAGANVTVFDASEKQLLADRMVADCDGLELETSQGDMADLSCFGHSAFDFIFHLCSNCFAEDLRPVWREGYRVLRPGGSIVSLYVKPIHGLLDPDFEKQGTFQFKFSMPHPDLQLSNEESENWFGSDAPI